MTREEWLTAAREGQSERDKYLLDIASKTFYRNIVTTDNSKYTVFPWGNRRAITPSANIYDGIWNWDTAFHIMALSRWDTELAEEQCRIFFDFQLENGMYPDCIATSGLVVDRFGKPPVLPWSFCILYKRTKNRDFLERAYQSCQKNLEFWEKYRRREGEVLYRYDTTTQTEPQRYEDIRFESGWDTSVRWDITADLYPIDLNCYMVTFYDSMSFMAKELGLDPTVYEQNRQRLVDEINSVMWDDKTKCYYDVSVYSKKPTYVMSVASFMPLYIGIADSERARYMHELSTDKTKFYPMLPTVSYDHPAYEAGNYWRGPCWLNAAYFALKGLCSYGYTETAYEIREVILNAVAGGTFMWDNTDAIFEYYNSTDGTPGGPPYFTWSCAFVIELILNL